MDWDVGVPITSNDDVLLAVSGRVVAIGILGASLQAAVSDVQGGAALVAVVLPIFAGDLSLGADGLDRFPGFMHEGVHLLAPPRGHPPALHHLVTVGGAAREGTLLVHVLPLKLLDRRFPRFHSQGRLDPSKHQDKQ